MDDDESQYHPPVTFYHGRKWDAPLTDYSIQMDPEFAQRVLNGETLCTLCQEPLLPEENIFLTPYMTTHIECNVRSGVGDVAHLEGRCICSGGEDRATPEERAQTYREASLAAVQWLVDHGRGRWADG